MSIGLVYSIGEVEIRWTVKGVYLSSMASSDALLSLNLKNKIQIKIRSTDRYKIPIKYELAINTAPTSTSMSIDKIPIDMVHF